MTQLNEIFKYFQNKKLPLNLIVFLGFMSFILVYFSRRRRSLWFFDSKIWFYVSWFVQWLLEDIGESI